MSKKTILVTGGAGFVGSHLCNFLLNKGNEVLCMDNFFTGKKDNIRHLMGYPNFEIIRHDICESFSLEVDEIYNLACPASPIAYQHDPVQTIKANVHGSINVLELAKRIGAKVLQASTSEVYGDPQVHPQVENYWGNVNPLGIRSCYDEGKRCAESLFMNYFRDYGVDIKIARIFNTYGPNMAVNDGRVVSNFINQALNNEDITIYGNGVQTRSFCFVSDLVTGLESLMATDKETTGPINLGNPNEITIKVLAEKIKKLINSKSRIINKIMPEDDPTRRKPDITKAKEKLKWKPIVSLDDGLSMTIKYFKELLNK